MLLFCKARGGECRRERIILALIIVVISIALAVLLSSCSSGGKSASGGAYSPAPTVKTQVEESDEVEPQPEPEKHEEEKKQDVTVVEVAPKEESNRVGESDSKTAKKQSAEPGTLVLELKLGETGRDRIALTFDAGASAKPTPALLSVLAQKGVRATFFLTGKWVDSNKELTGQIAAAGHEIGNHTYSHPDLRKVSDDSIRKELERTEAAVQAAAGVSTKPYFRAPYGARDSRVLKVALDEGYRSVFWTVDSWDAFKKGIKADEIEERVLERARDGAIVLMHCGSWPTVEALPKIIDELRARGYELVTVSELAQE